ncbi:hypothetical protein PUR25_30340 [Streptomyces sp. JV181]|uniref:hypothetical protein n=2 Tax=Streptomyces TaxID=1883 RepID=UPI002E7A8C29|nr:hypothetical protein [Streptomyces sp. JV181]MEE1780339.1 hypothetical protein [Streptomyces sp. JV181]
MMDDGTRAEADVPPGRGRLRGALNTVFVLVAVAGIGLSLWALVSDVLDLRTRAESRERIEEGCGGLVDPDRVLALNGGVDQVALSDRHRISTERTDSSCVVYRVGEPRSAYGRFSLDLTLYPANPDADEHQVDAEHEPFDYFTAEDRDDVTAAAQYTLPHPLGDGGLGEYDADTVTVRALCADGGGVSSVRAEVTALYDGPVTSGDRRELAALGRQAAERAAAETGCRAEIPAVPSALPEPRTTLVAAAEAGGTCAWYGRHTAAHGQGELPDRALAAPAGKAGAHDSCLLAMSPEGTERIWPAYEKSHPDSADLDRMLTLRPLWMQTDTLVGDGTRGLRSSAVNRTPVLPGTAGSADGIWWASSVCDGRPALHLMHVSFPYDDILRDRLEPLFRAYVEDATTRRGCTGVTFPAASAFAGP